MNPGAHPSKSVRAWKPDSPKQVDSENAKLVADCITNDFDSVGEDSGEMFKWIGPPQATPLSSH